MSILTNLFAGGAADLVKGVGGVIDNLHTSKEEKLAAEQKIQELISKYEIEMEKNITDRWKADMNSDSWLSKNVRPLVLIFLVVDAHHFILQAIVESFFIINPAEINFSSLTPEYMLYLFSGPFTTAVKIAAPIMAILFFLSVGLGLVARTVPQMNVFIVGFPLQIGVGLLMVGLSLSFFSVLVQQQMYDLPGKFMGFLRAL